MHCDVYYNTGMWEIYNGELDKEVVISESRRRFSSTEYFHSKEQLIGEKITCLFMKFLEELLCKHSFKLNKPNLS